MDFDVGELGSYVPGASVGPQHAATATKAISAQLAAVLKPGALSSKDKLLLLFATCAARRRRDATISFARKAAAAGATPGEIEEMLLACCVSRGVLVYLEGRAALAEAFPQQSTAVTPEADQDDAPGDDILAKFLGYFGTLPLWVELLAKQDKLIEGHQRVRELVFADGLAPRKIKELAFVCINCADLYGYGIELHTAASKAAGASQEEILEAIALSVIEGGIVSWIEGVNHYLGKPQ